MLRIGALLSVACLLIVTAPARAQAVPAPAQPGAGPGSGIAPAAGPADLYKSRPGPFAVTIIDRDWRDQVRDRTVPVRIYLPRRAGAGPSAEHDERHPLIVFSHGLGANRAMYRYFAEHLASHGYVVILPSHPGSDTAAMRDRLRQRVGPPGAAAEPAGEPAAERSPEQPPPRPRRSEPAPVVEENLPPAELHDAAPADPEGGQPPARRRAGPVMESIGDPDNLRHRPLDVSFVIDRALADDATADLVDAGRIGVAGHSFGAYTALAVGGLTIDLPGNGPAGRGVSFADPRVRAVVAMSPQGSGVMGITPGSWRAVAVPVLFLTGTRDYGAGERAAAWRREGFDAVRGRDACLVVITDATHFTFGGARTGVDSRHLDLVRSLAAAFFDAYLRDDAAAARFLREFAAGKHADCTAEFRPAP
jgi:predicted dienelactone hydrolase